MKTTKIILLISLLLSASIGFGGTAEDEYARWYQHGIDFVKAGDLNGAKQSFTLALTYKPGDPNAVKGLEMTEARLRQNSPPAQPVPTSYAVGEKPKSWSVRVNAGIAPGADEWEIEGFTGAMDDGSGMRVEVVAVRRFWNRNNPDLGWSIGGGLFVSNYSGTDAVGDELKASAYGIISQASFIGRAGKHAVWEVGPYMGLGLAEHEFPVIMSSETGPYAVFGVKAGIFYVPIESLEIGLELGFESFASTAEGSDGFNTIDVTFSGTGLRAAAVISYNF